MENEEIFGRFAVYVPLVVRIAAALAIFVVGWIAAKWTHALTLKALRGRRVDEALARFLASICQYAVLAATIITALAKVGVETTSLVALLATAGLAVGLALQGTLSNFAAGVMILFFRPFTLGDRVTAAGQTGKVEDIGLFATTLLTPSNETIILANSEVTGSSIVNFTARGTLRGEITIGVAYGTDLQQAMTVMRGACERCELVLDDPQPAVVFTGFGASSLDFAVRPWATTGEFAAMLHDVRVALYDDLNAAEIEIPFDQIVVHREGDDPAPES